MTFPEGNTEMNTAPTRSYPCTGGRWPTPTADSSYVAQKPLPPVPQFALIALRFDASHIPARNHLIVCHISIDPSIRMNVYT
jgi:hypothetical protein